MPAKQFLKEKDKKFRLLFEEHPIPMLILDPETHRIVEANAAAAEFYEYSLDELRNLPIDTLAVEEEARRFIQEVATPGRPGARAEWRQRTKTGRIVDVEMAVHEVKYGGRPATLALLTNISGRRQLQDQLRQAQKMEAVGMLAGGVAHDFNNLLTIITGYSQLILNNMPPNDPSRHSAEQIIKAGERAAALTRQLLAFSRREVQELKVLDLNQLVTGLSAMLRRLIGEDVDLRLALRPDLGRVNADPGQLEQVIMNLVVNARDAMPKGGALTIETANVDLDEDYAGRHIHVKPGPYTMLAVNDTGSGMDAETQARVFEPFFTTKRSGQGTGLGLSTVFGIVKQSGGSVEVCSEPGRGTSIKVYLPRINQPISIESPGAGMKTRRGTETILLVEDEDMVRTLVRDALRREGYRVLDAAGPAEAQRIAESQTTPIDLLITDVVMPKLSGRELADYLSRRRPAMKVLYMSGYTDSAVVNSGILRKDVAFLQKPFTPAALADKVREVLEEGRARHASE
jgi:two-component system, cell cycle sensor histidine kinase and response regulator CckA